MRFRLRFFMARLASLQEDEDHDHSTFVVLLVLKQQYRRLPTKYKVSLISFLVTFLFCLITGITLILCDVFTHEELLKHKGQPLVQRNCDDRDSHNNCVCNQGFKAIQNSYCEDINECIQVNCSENQVCLNTFGSYQCQCKPGYQLANNNISCHDIDECQQNMDSCHSNATCSNTIGLYSCKCKQGFRGDGWACIDTDECQVGIHQCHIHAQCFNTIGSYTCHCNKGFQGDGWSCVDIDECNDGSHDCSQDAHCLNLLGSHNCTCKNGFQGDGFNCTDIDECMSEPCHDHAACTNLHGNYSCSCNHGYRGNGLVCKKNGGSINTIPTTCNNSVAVLSLLVLYLSIFIL